MENVFPGVAAVNNQWEIEIICHFSLHAENLGLDLLLLVGHRRIDRLAIINPLYIFPAVGAVPPRRPAATIS